MSSLLEDLLTQALQREHKMATDDARSLAKALIPHLESTGVIDQKRLKRLQRDLQIWVLYHKEKIAIPIIAMRTGLEYSTCFKIIQAHLRTRKAS